MANILVLNAGSSSQKLALYQADSFPLTEPVKPLWARNIRLEDNTGNDKRAKMIVEQVSSLWSSTECILSSSAELTAAAHRVVHGGPKFERAVIVDDTVKASITEFAKFAPLQNPFNLLGIETIEALLPAVKQVAVFDTAFHATLPAVAQRYPIAAEWHERYGIRRYGFHGISHHYVSQRAAKLLSRDITHLRIVTCHLGSGCSLAAIRGGVSIDTTMGFSTLEGLMMGTRCGSIDPAIPLYLLGSANLTKESIERGLYHQSGLLGVSGHSDDMRQVIEAMLSGNQNAKLAFDMFIDRLAKGIAAMAVSLDGVDVIVFTGGIGENSALVRSAACNKLNLLAVALDDAANTKGAGDRVISKANSKVSALVIETHEDWAIAHDCHQLL